MSAFGLWAHRRALCAACSHERNRTQKSPSAKVGMACAQSEQDIDAVSPRRACLQGAGHRGTIRSPTASARDRYRARLHPAHAANRSAALRFRRLVMPRCAVCGARLRCRRLLIDSTIPQRGRQKRHRTAARCRRRRFAVELPPGTTSEEDNNASQLVTHSARPLRRDDLSGL